MNVLSYRTSDLNGLTFDLLVDDVPIFDLIGTDCMGIPYFLFENGMPLAKHFPGEYIVSVCSCGFAGCGSVYCKILSEGEKVTFSDFRFCENNPTFHFSESNYENVIREIIAEFSAEEEREREFGDDVMSESDIQHNRESISAYVKAVAAVLSMPDVANLISDEIQIPNYTAHEVARWLTKKTASDLVLELVPPELRELKKSVVASPTVDYYIPACWGLHVYGDDRAINVICDGYGESRMDLIESLIIPAPLQANNHK